MKSLWNNSFSLSLQRYRGDVLLSSAKKSRTADALAYYFALTERTSEICFGIVRFKKQREKPRRQSPYDL